MYICLNNSLTFYSLTCQELDEKIGTASIFYVKTMKLKPGDV